MSVKTWHLINLGDLEQGTKNSAFEVTKTPDGKFAVSIEEWTGGYSDLYECGRIANVEAHLLRWVGQSLIDIANGDRQEDSSS